MLALGQVNIYILLYERPSLMSVTTNGVLLQFTPVTYRAARRALSIMKVPRAGGTSATTVALEAEIRRPTRRRAHILFVALFRAASGALVVSPAIC
mmetsp:Transcript_11642/g.23664  ORF Transcript_11642/g.23664 Transcript_11642/m.23664 type:complete len:96 (+) Transcript_11642:62-349(+)